MALDLLAHSFLFWPLFFVYFFIFSCFIYFLLLLNKRVFNVLVVVYFYFIGFIIGYLWGLFLGGGFKGQLRWPQGQPHLAFLGFFLFVECVFFFFVLQGQTIFLSKKGAFLLFSACSPLFLSNVLCHFPC